MSGNLDQAIRIGLERISQRIREVARDNAPYRTGDLKKSIHASAVEWHNGIYKANVGTNLFYAHWIHEGTGIYGPLKRRIRPTTKPALFWPGAKHPMLSVAGMKPRRFLLDAARHVERDVKPIIGKLLGPAIIEDIRKGLKNLELTVKI